MTLKGSHQSRSKKKGVFKNFAKFTGKHLCQSFFFNKVAGLSPATFLRTPPLQNISGRLLFNFLSSLYIFFERKLISVLLNEIKLFFTDVLLENKGSTFRISRTEVSVKKLFLKILQIYKKAPVPESLSLLRKGFSSRAPCRRGGEVAKRQNKYIKEMLTSIL